MSVTEEQQRIEHPLGVSAQETVSPARQAVNEMVDAGLLDAVMDRVDAGQLALTGGRWVPSTKASTTT